MTNNKIYLQLTIGDQHYYILYGYRDFAKLIKNNDFIYFKGSEWTTPFAVNVKRIQGFHEIMNNCVEGGFDKMRFFYLHELDLELVNNELS